MAAKYTSVAVSYLGSDYPPEEPSVPLVEMRRVGGRRGKPDWYGVDIDDVSFYMPTADSVRKLASDLLASLERIEK
jgi:hypothetical protein